MTWVAPPIDRFDEPFDADERTTLEGMLDRQRATLLWKCAGLTGEQLVRQSVPVSTMSLLGLVRHIADAERSWFRVYVGGEVLPEVYARDDKPDAAFEEASAEHAEEDFARLENEWELIRQSVAGKTLEDSFVHERHGRMTVRWVYNHMIEEYARHNGHADLIRESIDGATGE